MQKEDWLTCYCQLVQILQRDAEAQDKAPEVMKQDMNSKSGSTTKPPSGSRSFSTSARRNATELQATSNPEGPPPDMAQFQGTRIVGLEYPDAGFGHKFPLPDLKPLGKAVNFKKRYDPVVEQVTRSLMRDGKLSRAQKVWDKFSGLCHHRGHSIDMKLAILTKLSSTEHGIYPRRPPHLVYPSIQ